MGLAAAARGSDIWAQNPNSAPLRPASVEQ
jgi:hypothetical protein